MNNNDQRGILIVDDDPFALKLLSVQLRAFGLRNHGYPRLHTVQCPDDAVALLEDEQDDIGLVFCDLQMPGMDGVEFIRHLGRIGYQGGVVLVSGEDRRILQATERLAMVHSLNILGALQKPVSREQLRRVLEFVLPEGEGDAPVEEVAYTPSQLRHALESGQLLNYYQPKVNMATGEVVGAEALVRWQHPVDGLVPPMRFIDLAEQHGMLDELAHQVLRDALRQARCWRDAGHPLAIAVNMAMSNLRSLDFPDTVAQQVSEAGLPLDSLTLEITEAQLMTDPRSQLDILARLRLKGIRLSIDDFGIGYSTLAQLRDLPFDELKIDRSFVHQAGKDPALKAILNASLELAAKFGMHTVGEGISEHDDWETLRRAGCELAQGYFIARPMPGDEMPDWLARWRSGLPTLLR